MNVSEFYRKQQERLRLDAIHATAQWAFLDENPGYRPEVTEIPNGDAIADKGKRYAHVAPKYGMPRFANQLWKQLRSEAADIALALGVPRRFAPGRDSTIRYLIYPPGTGSAMHTDFSLLTINVWRNVGNPGLAGAHYHTGELMTEITGRPAEPHAVLSLPERQQSCVFFAVPEFDTVLPSGKTVGEWMKERKGRSRI